MRLQTSTLARSALVCVSMCVALAFGMFGYALASDTRAPIRATVRCNSTAEDTLGHVRMVVFDRNDDGSVRVVYRCMHTGY